MQQETEALMDSPSETATSETATSETAAAPSTHAQRPSLAEELGLLEAWSDLEAAIEKADLD